ncbi:HlyD family secretion protein [Saprospira grandis]|uniref:HlyD family secretion protein n=1 Tax=Saprospira grandis TaxID=1008 RepID=UPI0022DCEA19|nr:biotin/lipoyl-binding protein [Saprospira grandis]WBM74907.1 biotin/lipoyl-binding protein [Saprospira grandis]
MKRLFILGLLPLLLFSCQTEEQPEKIKFPQGKVKYKTLGVSSKIAGRLAKIYVKEGQLVQKGDTLARLDIPEIAAKMAQAEGAILAASGQLEMAKNGATSEQRAQLEQKIEAAKAQLAFAEASEKRLAALHADSLLSTQSYEEVAMKVELAQAQLAALKEKRKEVEKGSRSELVQQAQGQLARAQAAKQELEVAQEEIYIISPANFRIETISLEEGELLGPGYSLFYGYKTESMYFRFSIAESEIYNFEEGQKINVQNPYTKEEIPCELRRIKQLARYASQSSAAPNYELAENLYELQLWPIQKTKSPQYVNATVLLLAEATKK